MQQQIKFFSLVFCVFFVFLCVVCSAQKITYSPVSRENHRNINFSILGKCMNKVVVFKNYRNRNSLEYYDAEMNVVDKVLLPFIPKSVQEIEGFTYPNKTILMYDYVKKGSTWVSVARLNGMGQLIGKPYVIDSVSNTIFSSKQFVFLSSMQKKYMCAFSKTQNLMGSSISGVIIDSAGAVQSRFNIEGNAQYKNIWQNIQLDDNGTLYWIKGEQTNAQSLYKKIDLCLKPLNSKEVKNISLNLDNEFVDDLVFKKSLEGNMLYIAGFYYPEKRGSAYGVIKFSVDFNSNTLVDKKIAPFNADIKDLTGNPTPNEAFDKYAMRHLVLKPNGAYTCIAEKFYITQRYERARNGSLYYANLPTNMITITTYNYEDVVLINFDSLGSISNYQFVRKKQFSEDDKGLYSGFFMTNTGGQLHILFNEINNNLAMLIDGAIEGNGDYKRNSMLENGGGDYIWIPTYGKQIGKKQVIIPCLLKDYLCFAKIEY